MPTKKAAKKGPKKAPEHKKAPAKATAAEPEANSRDLDAAPTPAPPGINDVREDGAAVLGHFVEVVDGKHKGRYGVFEEVSTSGRGAIVRTRDNDSARITCDISDLVPAEAGRR
jgi:hypothetical protein